MSPVDFWESAFLWRDPLIAATLAALLLAYIGFFVVLTRNAFAGAAISQLAALGSVVALALGAPSASSIPALVALLFGVAGAGFLGLPGQGVRMASDSVLALVVVGASALTLVLGNFLTTDYQHVQAAMYGDIVVATTGEVVALAVVAGVLFGLHRQFYDRFWLVATDPETAMAGGMQVGRWRLLLFLTIGLALALVTQLMGALVAFAFVVLPASGGLLAVPRLRPAIIVALLTAALSASGGYVVSFFADTPTGPTVVVMQLAFFGVLALIGRRG